MRLIDADALIQDITTSKNGFVGTQSEVMIHDEMCDYAIEQIGSAETVERSVPVARCGLCKHSRYPNSKDFYENMACEGVLICTNCNDTVRPQDDGRKFVLYDWYCADGQVDGKRRE